MIGVTRGNGSTVFRNRGIRFICVPFYVIAVMFCTLAGWVGALIAVALTWLLIKAFRAGIEVGADGILVRRFGLRNEHLDWAEVDRAELVSNGNAGGGCYIALRLHDGRVVKTQGLVVNSRESAWGASVMREIDAARPQQI
jgi:hypothetical protein